MMSAFETVFRKPKTERKDHVGETEMETDILSGIFSIGDMSFDVVLTKSKLTWSPLTSSDNKRFNKKKKKYKPDENENDLNSVFMKNTFAARVKRQRRSDQREGEGVCLGFAVYTYIRRENPNKLRVRAVEFNHPSEDVCNEWTEKIDDLLKEYSHRPKRAKVFIQPFAGKRTAHTVYKEKVAPLFRLARMKHEISEVEHNEYILHDLIHSELNKYDCLVVVGGDGTVTKALDALLKKTQKDAGIVVKNTTTPAKASLPLAIIPIGSTNFIAHSIHGVEDPVTSAIHVVLGNTMPVDAVSIYKEDKLHKFAFNSQYGYPARILDLTYKYAMLGQKKMNAAIVHFLKKSTLRSYECDIQYIPSPCQADSHPMDRVVCKTGCTVCDLGNDASSRRGSVYSDSVHDFDPLALSSTSSTIIDLSKENPWKSLKGDFVSVSLLTLPGRSEVTPQGLSKYTHLADGCMDLVVVKNSSKKDFVRHLRRHANSKNQFDFPFVETLRVTEVRFHHRSQKTWNQGEQAFNEIEYEMGRMEMNSSLSRRSEREEVLVMNSDDEEEELRQPSMNESWRSESRISGNISLNETSSMVVRQASLNGSLSSIPPRWARASPTPSRSDTPTQGGSLSWKERRRRKEERRKSKMEAKAVSLWNLDNELCQEADLDFRVHAHLVRVFAQGVSVSTPLEEGQTGCLRF